MTDTNAVREPEKPDYERLKRLAIPRAFTDEQFGKQEYHQILSRALWLERRIAELENDNAELRLTRGLSGRLRL